MTPPLLLLGGTVNALTVARSMAQAGVPVHAVADGLSPSLVRHSRYLQHFVDVSGPTTAHGEWLEWLPHGPRGAVVLPCADPGAEFIALHRDRLLELGYVPVPANDEAVLAMLDKTATYALAEKHGVEVPRTMAVQSLEDLAVLAGADGFDFPLALKPSHAHRALNRLGKKAVVVQDHRALAEETARILGLGIDLLVTEIVHGPDSAYCSYYTFLDDAGEPLLHFTKRKPRQYPPGFGWGCFHETAWEPDAAAIGLRFFQEVGLRGIGNVEFKRDPRDGHLKLIECNPRITAATELVRLAGVDLAGIAYQRALGRPVAHVGGFATGLREWYPLADTRAFLALRRDGQLRPSEWARSVRPPVHLPIFDGKDLTPSIAHLRDRTVGFVTSRLRPRGGTVAVAPVMPPGAGCRRHATPTTKVLAALADRGKIGAELGWRLDLLRAAGGRASFRHLLASPHASDPSEEFHRRIWEEAAVAVDAQVLALGAGFLTVRRGQRATTVWENQVMLDDPVTLRLAADKSLSHRLLTAAGLPVPPHAEFTAEDLAPAVQFLRERADPCVVKPASGTGGGYGVTCGVRDVDDLVRACTRARHLDRRMLIEQQATGEEYRLLFLDGTFLDAIRRRPLLLMGDGRSTVRDLVVAANAQRATSRGRTGLRRIEIDLDSVLALRSAGMSLRSVPRAGASVRVKSAANVNDPADNETVHDLSPDLVADAARAVATLGLRLASVEVVTPEPTTSLRAGGGVVLEVNGTPGLHYHYLVAAPDRATRVAVPILEALLGVPVGRQDSERVSAARQ